MHVFLAGLRVAATILGDGFVAGVWKIEKTKGDGHADDHAVRAAGARDPRRGWQEEGERLVRFVEGESEGIHRAVYGTE